MDLTVAAFLLLLSLVAVERLVELRISRRHQRQLAQRGIQKYPDSQFRWMVLLHAGILAGAAIEVLALHRPFRPVLAAAMAILFALATAVRWWVIRTLGTH